MSRYTKPLIAPVTRPKPQIDEREPARPMSEILTRTQRLEHIEAHLARLIPPGQICTICRWIDEGW